MPIQQDGPVVVDEPMPFRVARTFYLNQYTTSHLQLILRSPRDTVHDERIDVSFRGVAAVVLPGEMPALCVRVASEDEVRVGLGPFRRLLDEYSTLIAFVVCEEPELGFVIAGAAYTVTDGGFPGQPSALLWDFEQTTPPDLIRRLV